MKGACRAVRATRKYTIHSLNRGLRILRILGESGDPLGVTEVSWRLGIDKNTMYRLGSDPREAARLFMAQSERMLAGERKEVLGHSRARG